MKCLRVCFTCCVLFLILLYLSLISYATELGDSFVEALVFDEPVIDEPVIDEPVIDEPVIDEPVIDEPVIDEPVIDEPVIDEPVIDEPVIDEPVIDEPVIDEPVIDEPVIDEPVIDEPVIDEPVIDDPIIELLPDDELFLEEDFHYEFPEYTFDDPLPVIIVEDEESFSNVRVGSRAAPVLVIGDVAPDNPLFYGSGWITGTDSNLGQVTLYFPISYKTGYFGLDSNGYLFNVSSSSISGYLEDAYNNSISAPGFSYPHYRETNLSSYTTLYLRPENSNMDIAVSNAPRYSVTDFVPYVLFFIGGALILCYLKRS